MTSALLWRATLVAAATDVPLLFFAARFVTPAWFARLKWHLVAAATLVYAVLWGVVASWVC